MIPSNHCSSLFSARIHHHFKQALSILLAIHADDDGLKDQRGFLSNNQPNRLELPNAVIKSINLTVTIDRRTNPFIGVTTQVMPATYNSAAERNKNAQVITDRPLTTYSASG
jgi:hypothetical protein